MSQERRRSAAALVVAMGVVQAALAPVYLARTPSVGLLLVLAAGACAVAAPILWFRFATVGWALALLVAGGTVAGVLLADAAGMQVHAETRRAPFGLLTLGVAATLGAVVAERERRALRARLAVIAAARERPALRLVR